MKALIFQAPTCIFPSKDLVFPRLQPCQFETLTSRAPTLPLVQAPTWFLEGSNPLGLQPYLPRHRPCLYEAPTSWAPTLNFTSSKHVWLFFTAHKVFFNKPCHTQSPRHIINDNLFFLEGVTTALHRTQTISPSYLMMTSAMHHDLQCYFQDHLRLLNKYLQSSSRSLHIVFLVLSSSLLHCFSFLLYFCITNLP